MKQQCPKTFQARIALITLFLCPYIVSSPPNEIQVQHVGDTVQLNCSAGGSPLPKVTWFKDGRRVFSRTVYDGNGLIKSEMVIHRFKPSDWGIYTCLFYNGKNMTAESKTNLGMLNFIYNKCLTRCLFKRTYVDPRVTWLEAGDKWPFHS